MLLSLSMAQADTVALLTCTVPICVTARTLFHQGSRSLSNLSEGVGMPYSPQSHWTADYATES